MPTGAEARRVMAIWAVRATSGKSSGADAQGDQTNQLTEKEKRDERGKIVERTQKTATVAKEKEVQKAENKPELPVAEGVQR